MIQANDLIEFAARILFDTNASEAALRRAVSAAYYGLFHTLAEAGSERYAAGDARLQAQVARAYNHGAMRKVCEAFVRSRSQPLPPPLNTLVHGVPDDQLLLIADTFLDLQDRRHSADYDLTSSLTWDEAKQLVSSAILARDNLAVIREVPETRVFLTALLLADRWTRRG